MACNSVHMFYSARITITCRKMGVRPTVREGGIVSGHPVHRGNSVLIVDDDAVSRYFCEQALVKGDRHVLLAANADAAMHLVRTWRPAVIVLDLHLQSEHGEVLRETMLSEWPRDMASPTFIAMTGDEIRAGKASLQVAGFSKVLRKPFGVKLLRDLVDQASKNPSVLTSPSATRPTSARPDLKQILRAEWCAAVDELDLHISEMDWDKAIGTVHRLAGAAALAGLQELAQGARTLLREMTSDPHGQEMMNAYADFLWQGVEFTRTVKEGAFFSGVADQQAHFSDCRFETNEYCASND